MPATLRDTVQTQYTQYELTKAFVDAWVLLYGTFPQKKQIAVIWAQNALETGMSAMMWNNNIGNVKYIANPTDDASIEYCMLKNVWEIVNGQRVTFQPPNPATWFRSFPTLTDGVHYYFDFLRNRRYKIAWAAVEAGDPLQFAHLLKVQGYYSAPEADYAKAEIGYFNRFMQADYFDKALPPEVNPDTGPIFGPTDAPVSPSPVSSVWNTVSGLFGSIFRKK